MPYLLNPVGIVGLVTISAELQSLLFSPWRSASSGSSC